jgi:hypothetical protein
MDVFVSYTGADRSWAEWISEELERAGLSVALQAWDVPFGENFVTWIGTRLRDARYTLAVYSAAYFRSSWCTQEWTSSLARHTLLAVRVEDVTVPPPLDVCNYADLFGLDESTARRRLQVVGVLAVEREAPGGFPGNPGGEPASAARFPPLFSESNREPPDESDRFRAPGWSELPALPERFLERPMLLGRVRAELCADHGGQVPVVGLVGMAGAGKSTLARSVVIDPAVQARFPDGAVWLDVGPKQDLVSCLIEPPRV